ncbi:MAG: hypothetical protein A3F40_04880 [Chlamydiae bacterium RIFCSPHIGHO2_12_FULL_27_8]|nr:MAG: hypothetical protein A3F40_04880 [Chlamydiae bacterium RIFCSPHIGHO2_12_FULL_27_8]
MENETKNLLINLLNEENKKPFEKKPLRTILSSYMAEKPKDKKTLLKMKEELKKIKESIKDAKTSVETLVEIQKKLSKIFEEIEDEKKETV